jgi:hypothetical protein
MLQTLQAKGYRAVTVGECLGDPEANWYRSDSGSAQVKRHYPSWISPAEENGKADCNDDDSNGDNLHGSADGLRYPGRHLVPNHPAGVYDD